MDVLAAHREKWREVPGGDDTDGRRYSSDLLKLPDAELLSFWDGMAANRASGVIGWIGPLYRDFTNGRRVLELGSGLGLDGLRFASQGAHWTFADIAADNLAMIERIAALKGLKVTTHLIGPDLSFDKLDGQFDAVLACGSVHHVPFEVARQECLNVLKKLKLGGRWLELVYPKERWEKAGSPSFEQWGKMTDGDRTPGPNGTMRTRSVRVWPLPGSGPSSTSASPPTTIAGWISSTSQRHDGRNQRAQPVWPHPDGCVSR